MRISSIMSLEDFLEMGIVTREFEVNGKCNRPKRTLEDLKKGQMFSPIDTAAVKVKR